MSGYYWLALVAGIIVCGLCIEIFRELHGFQVTKYEIKSDRLRYDKKPVRAVFLSDLHNQVYGDDNEILLRKIRIQNPDYIFIGGDMLVGKSGCSYQHAVDFVKKLAKEYPVYYALGNHEQRMKENPQNYEQHFVDYQKELIDAGVSFLENQCIFLETRCGKIQLVGFEIPERCYVRFRKANFLKEEMENMIGTTNENVFSVLMAHNPTYMDTYLSWGASLVLSGHLHGGVIRIPGFSGVISPAFMFFPKYSGGHYQKENADIVVSKGLGVHTIKLRLFNPAEIVVIDLNGSKRM